MKRIINSVFIIISIMNGCNMRDNNRIIQYTNAKFFTCDSNFTVFTNMFVQGDKVIALTDSDKRHLNPDTIIDLEGNFVYPGFIDAHCHFLYYAKELQYIDLKGTLTFDELLDRLKQNVKESDSLVLGTGWDQNNWPDKRFPHRHKLDSMFPDKPVYLRRIDGHAALVNSKLMEISGLDKNTKIPGGKILKDDDGLTGILIDKAATYIFLQLPETSSNELTDLLHKAENNCFSKGLTMICDAGLDLNDISLLQSLADKKSLSIRMYIMMLPTDENIKAFPKPFRTDHVSIRSFKFYADGALGSRGALLSKPYQDDPDNYGINLLDEELLNAVCQIAINRNFQVNTHCIGDSALRNVLNIYQKYLPENNDFRWRIEHSQVVSPKDLPIFGKLDIVPSVQSRHATSDMDWAEDRLGAQVKNAYIYKKLLEQNGWIANGSDFPVEPIDPILGFYAATIRKDPDVPSCQPFQPENKLDRKDALLSMTLWAAKAAFEENTRGSLEVGKLADFVVLDTDLTVCKEEEIIKSKVLATYIDGIKVYESVISDW